METIISKAEQKMNKTINALENEYAVIRAGRANPAVLDKINVDYYGVPTPINQLATISVPEARMLLVQPWDKSSIKAIEKAIQTSDIGINPQNDGGSLRLMFPPLTEERRRDLVKSINKYAEDGKIAVRSIRRDAIEKLKNLKKNSDISEDDLRVGEKDIQDLTDRFCKDIDVIATKKEKEIMEI